MTGVIVFRCRRGAPTVLWLAENRGPKCDTISRTDLDLGRDRQRHVDRIRSPDNRRRWRSGGGDTRSFCCGGGQDCRSIPAGTGRRPNLEVKSEKCLSDMIGRSTARPMRHAKNAKRERKLSLVNARGLLICKINYAIASPPPRCRCPSQGVSSLTWTAGESRAVLFIEKQIASKKAKAGFGD